MGVQQLQLGITPGKGRKKFPTSFSSPYQSLASVSCGQAREGGFLGDLVSKCQPLENTAGGNRVEHMAEEQKIIQYLCERWVN